MSHLRLVGRLLLAAVLVAGGGLALGLAALFLLVQFADLAGGFFGAP